MLNVEKSRLDKVIGNEKLMPVVTALGTGIGDEFDITKLRYHKVVIMADADVDGAHIRTLMLTFFFRYMRPLIDSGYIYIAQPPLFKVSKGKKVKYAFSDEERDEFIAEFGGNCDVQRYKGLVRWIRSSYGKPRWIRSFAQCSVLPWRMRCRQMKPSLF